MESIVPQAPVATFVAQAIDQVTVRLLVPVTEGVNCNVVLVMTLADTGEMVNTTVDAALLPHPDVPTATANVKIK